MVKLRILKKILIQTGADKILGSYVGYILVCALLIWIWEPGVRTYRDGLWYCYAVISTVGFGDVLVHTFVGRALSVLLSVYSVLVVAIITGVVVSTYTEIVHLRHQESFAAFINKLENLPDLSREELEELSKKVRDREFRREIEDDRR